MDPTFFGDTGTPDVMCGFFGKERFEAFVMAGNKYWLCSV